MANWVSNIVEITGYEIEDKLKEFMDWMRSVADTSCNQGVRPECSTGRYMFDIQDVECEIGTHIGFRFETKWVPALITMKQAAEHYRFSFTMEFEEGGDCLYGDCTYDVDSGEYLYRKVPLDVYLDVEDNSIESFYDALDRLLDKQPYIKI